MGKAVAADFVLEGSFAPHRATAGLYRVADNTQVWSAVVDPTREDPASQLAARIARTFPAPASDGRHTT
jgi:hypothetical protein